MPFGVNNFGSFGRNTQLPSIPEEVKPRRDHYLEPEEAMPTMEQVPRNKFRQRVSSWRAVSLSGTSTDTVNPLLISDKVWQRQMTTTGEREVENNRIWQAKSRIGNPIARSTIHVTGDGVHSLVPSTRRQRSARRFPCKRVLPSS